MLSIVKDPWLQSPGCNTITIMWETSEPAESQVSYWETELVHSGLHGTPRLVEDTERSIINRDCCTIHTLTLTGLQTDTSYYYQVSSRLKNSGDTVKSNKFILKTAVAKDTPFSFAVCSETGGAGDHAMSCKIFSTIETYRPEFLLMVGDAVRNGTQYEDWEKWFFSPGQNLFTNTPFYLCPGNHEEYSPWFYKFTANPDPGNYYTFDYGNARFVALDSPAMVSYKNGSPQQTEEFRTGSPQLAFLEEKLASTDAKWKFVFFHYPPYVSADYQVNEMRLFCPIIEKYGVDIVFNSHTIIYERSHPLRAGKVDKNAGTIYVVAGGAGAMQEWLHPKRAWHTAQSLARPHFIQVVIAGGTLELRAIDENGYPFDYIQLEK